MCPVWFQKQCSLGYKSGFLFITPPFCSKKISISQFIYLQTILTVTSNKKYISNYHPISTWHTFFTNKLFLKVPQKTYLRTSNTLSFLSRWRFWPTSWLHYLLMDCTPNQRNTVLHCHLRRKTTEDKRYKPILNKIMLSDYNVSSTVKQIVYRGDSREKKQGGKATTHKHNRFLSQNSWLLLPASVASFLAPSQISGNLNICATLTSCSCHRLIS